MSVKISRREEKRNTSLRDFILAAVFPLLVAGLIGFIIGKAGNYDTSINRGELASLQEQAQLASAEATALKAFLLQVDSLRDNLEQAVKDHDGEFENNYQKNKDEIFSLSNPLSEWLGEARALKNRYSDEIHQIKADARLVAPPYQKAVVELFENLNSRYYLAAYDKKTYFEGTSGNMADLTEQHQEEAKKLQQEIDELAGDSRILEQRLENKDLELANLQLQLTQSGQVVPSKSFASEKGQINEAVIQIENIAMNIPSGVLVKKKRKEEIVGQIKVQAGKIKNALLLIE